MRMSSKLSDATQLDRQSYVKFADVFGRRLPSFAARVIVVAFGL